MCCTEQICAFISRLRECPSSGERIHHHFQSTVFTFSHLCNLLTFLSLPSCNPRGANCPGPITKVGANFNFKSNMTFVTVSGGVFLHRWIIDIRAWRGKSSMWCKQHPTQQWKDLSLGDGLHLLRWTWKPTVMWGVTEETLKCTWCFVTSDSSVSQWVRFTGVKRSLYSC